MIKDIIYIFQKILSELMVSIGLPIKLRDLKLKEEDLDLLVTDSVNPERMKNNPVILNKTDIRTILTNIL